MILFKVALLFPIHLLCFKQNVKLNIDFPTVNFPQVLKIFYDWPVK